MVEKQTSSFSLSSALIGGLIGIAIGYFIIPLLTPSSDCQAPPGLEQVATTDGAVRIRWQAAKNDVIGYLVWARDSTKLADDSVASSITVVGTEAVIPGLLPNKTYKISVFSICRNSKGEFNFSKTPREIWTRTGYIVVEDIVHINDDGARSGCPFNTCDSLVMQNDSCFNWGTGDWNYQIEVFERTTSGVSTTPILRTYLQKISGNNTLIVRSFTGAPCDGAAPTIGGLPSTANCASGSCASANTQLCGQLALPGGNVCYGIKVDFADCCITGLPKSRYSIKVSRCRFASVDQ
jgi:hypothetical protein